MLEKIEIRNFGNHTKQDIEFGSGVTTIVGSNFAGKSTIIRALRWVVLNRPAGDQFINWEADKASVRLSFDDSRITRKRGKGDNTYRYNKMDYAAFGNDVPPLIRDTLNISDINFQNQHAAPFWFCETAGEVSRQLNTIVNLEVIDTTLSNVASELRKARAVVEITQERLDKAVVRKKELAYVDDMNQDLVVMEDVQTQLLENAVGRARLVEIIELRAKYLFVRENALGLASDGLIAMSEGRLYQEITSQTEILSKLVDSGQRLFGVVEARPSSLKPLEKLMTEVEKIISQYNSLFGLIESVESRKEMKCKTERELGQCKKEFSNAVGKQCPLCGQPIQIKK